MLGNETFVFVVGFRVCCVTDGDGPSGFKVGRRVKFHGRGAL